MDVDRLKQFVEADWEQITPRLVKYAVFKVRRLEWRTGSFLPKGLLPEDLALEAIRKTCEGLQGGTGGEAAAKTPRGMRIWDAEKNPDLFEFLKGVVDSDVNALVESTEHRLTDYSANLSPQDAHEHTVHAIDASGAVHVERRSLSAEEALLRREKQLDEETRVNKLMSDLEAMCADDEEELLILLAYREAAKKHEKVKPQLVAKYSGLDEKTTRNAMRRLARKVERRRYDELG